MALANLSDGQIIERCRKEREPSHKRLIEGISACLELLHRAIIMWRPEAFEAVHLFYGRELITWVVTHRRYEELCIRAPHLTPDDIVQNVYIKLHRALSKRQDFYEMFKTVGYFMAYCRGAVSNCVNDHLPRKPKSVEQPVSPPNEPSTPRQSQSTNPNPSPTLTPSSQDSDKSELLGTDANRERDSVEAEIDEHLFLEHVRGNLSDADYNVFLHKVFEIPTREELLEAGMAPKDIELAWRRTRAKLRRDPKVRQILGL